ncbi:radical SAM protein [Fundidesulfovibrio putealis]|uniref:radical SAM protein n=1 Tax=Fundidesulfovibrio putealis TaxID=270496 RepID=UPI00040DAE8A|nr:radical SAM protein [Fundidesulfovibrio putealis]
MAIKYTKLKAFHFPDVVGALPRESGQVHAPLHIRFKPTNVCSHNCRYCAYRAANLQLGQDMDPRATVSRGKMLELVEDFTSMGVKAVTFSGGGDPFCWPHLAECVRGLAAGGVKTASLTNGALLRGEAAEALAEHGSWLRVSMDGWDADSYAAYRGVGRNEFAKVLANMEAFKRLGGSCFLGVSLVIDKDNAPYIYDLTARLRDVGVDSVKYGPCIISNDAAENNAYHAPILTEVKLQAERAKNELAGPDFEIFDSYHLLDEKFTKPYTWCPYLQLLTVVGADLNVYSCQDKAYNLGCGLLGSIRERRFRDFWMDGKDKFFTIDPSRHCSHHCVANGKNSLVLEFLEADRDHLAFV